MRLDFNNCAFLPLLRAGLWEHEVRLSSFNPVDFQEILRLAQEQAVVGLIAAGLEHVSDFRVPKDDALLFAGLSIQLEQVNVLMNQFIKELANKMQAAGINALLIKGQGVAQCYERPLLRASGDVDLLVDSNGYLKAKDFLSSIAQKEEAEVIERKHVAFYISSWEVELHGTLRGWVLPRIDKNLDVIQDACFRNNMHRLWEYNGAAIKLPCPDDDVIFCFTHILQHFYKEGIGLRQICDLCRLLWFFKEQVNSELLRFRLFAMGIESEWKAFGALIVEYLGMPAEFVPLYSPNRRWKRKAEKIMTILLETGSFGSNKDLSYMRRPFFIR